MATSSGEGCESGTRDEGRDGPPGVDAVDGEVLAVGGHDDAAISLLGEGEKRGVGDAGAVSVAPEEGVGPGAPGGDDLDV